jgi:mono/diheme cytochrome c family protein
MKRNWPWFCCLTIAALLVRSAIGQEQAKSEKPPSPSAAVAAAKANAAVTPRAASPLPGRDISSDERMARLEGEKRFRANCGRCHQPPHKLPPRVMAAAIRHMRVRAMITAEDMKFILRYMTQ